VRALAKKREPIDDLIDALASLARIGQGKLRDTYDETGERDLDLSTDKEPAGYAASPWTHKAGKYGSLSWNPGQ